MLLSVFDVLTPEHISLDLQASDQRTAIAATTALLATSPYMRDVSAFTQEVLAREKLSPTAMGQGVAFPHARTATVEQIVMAAARSTEGIPFGDSSDRVHLIFLIGTPQNMVREYLGLVGDLARRLKQPNVREQMLQATTTAEFLEALRTACKG
jgi:mannitol/fructose-specific phosphotransferase system IIA component (Ntr-type)